MSPSTAPSPSLAELRLVGRFEPPSPGEVRTLRFAWSGSTFEARFTGSSVGMRLRAAPLAPHTVRIDGKEVSLAEKTTPYRVLVDDRPPVTLEVSSERERYELATGLDPARPHTVRVMREAEAFAGVHELLGIDLSPGGSLLPLTPRGHRIEVIGDSITCGYGALGVERGCPFTYATERASASFAVRLGAALDADVSLVCWSGRGVLRNYDGSTTGTMPALFETTLPEAPAAAWAFGTAPPEAVIVALGTNDVLGGGGEPLDYGAFEATYVQFLRRLRDVYPKTWLIMTTSPMIAEQPRKDLTRHSLERVLSRRIGDGEKRIELVVLDTDAPHWGCDGHPDAEMHARLAARLEPIVRAATRMSAAVTP